MGVWDTIRSWVGGPAQTAAETVQPAAPSLLTTDGSSSALGTAPETPGYTSTGGRRLKKTRKSKRRSKKTRRH
jgi:hypothetical protein